MKTSCAWALKGKKKKKKTTGEKRTIVSEEMRLSLFGVKSVIFWVICRITWQIQCEIRPSMYLIASWLCGTSLVAQTVKNLPTAQKTQAQSLGRGDPLEKGMTTHSVFLPGNFSHLAL